MSDADHIGRLSGAVTHILQRLDALEAQVAYLSQAHGNPEQGGFSGQPAPIGAPGPGPVAAAGLDAQMQKVVALAQSGNKLAAIKLYRELTNCDLRTAKSFVDQY